MKRLLGLVLAGLVALAPAVAFAAAPKLPSVSTAVFPLTFHLTGDVAAATGIISFPAAADMRVLYVTAVAQAKSGTQGTSTIQCKNGSTAFTNAMDLTGTAGTAVEATLVAAQQSIAKDTVVTCDLVISGGSTPKLFNINVVIWAQRR